MTGTEKWINFNGRAIPYMDGFRLIMLTQHRMEAFPARILDEVLPSFWPEERKGGGCRVQVSVVNFVVTRQGIEDGLLELFLEVEAPELEAEKEVTFPALWTLRTGPFIRPCFGNQRPTGRH